MATASSEVKWWQATAEKSVVGSSTGFAAKFWTWAEGVYETSGRADPNAHAISFCLDPLQTEFSLGRRASFSGIFSPGMMAVIPAGEEPKAVQRGGGRKLHLYLPLTLWNDVAEDCGSSVAPDISAIGVVEDLAAHTICRKMMGVLSETGPGSRMLMDAFGIELAVHAVRRWSSLNSPNRFEAQPLGFSTIARVMTYLNDNLARDATLSELAAIAGLSPAHFCRSFRKTTGKPPHQYLLQLRLKKAQELLTQTNLGVGEIAAAVGYDDPSYFARLFKKQIGITPNKFRSNLL